jgi:hypothetical protein
MSDFVKINLQQKRSFSELISVTFDFIVTNFRILGLSFLVFSLPLIIPGSYLISSSLEQLSSANGVEGFMSGLFGSMIFGYIFFMVASLLYYMVVNVLVSLYHQMEDPRLITVKMIWDQILPNLGGFIGAGILIALMVMVSMVLLILPAIYIGIAVSFTFFAIAYEKKGLGEAISRSFQIIKGNWWSTFGFMFVIGIIQVVISYTISLPLSFLSMYLIIPSSQAGETVSNLNWFWLFLTYFIQLGFGLFVSAIPTVAIIMKYFSLVEMKENIGLLDQIDQMGNQSNL